MALFYALLYSLIISANLSIYSFFDIENMHLYTLFFKILINLSSATDFPSLYAECLSRSLS